MSLLKHLSELGLSEREARVYLYLVRAGEANAREVSEGVGIPYSKVYSVLRSLEDKGWVEADRSIRPTTYRPVSPDVAVRRALERELNRIQRELEEHAKVAVRKLSEMYRAERETVARTYHGKSARETLAEVLRSSEDIVCIVHLGRNLPRWLLESLRRMKGSMVLRAKEGSEVADELEPDVKVTVDIEPRDTLIVLSADRREFFLGKFGVEGDYLLSLEEPILAQGIHDAVTRACKSRSRRA
ncbi:MULTISPECIES: TrmB family transcriptional regulator [unclassified Methanopyrus]|uniref:TrmB family transcriptional regulator n=1 Tax=Methanopyrus sp. SNP6 TaxID=1937005 RepID=UPI0011E58D81|nr:TrmB family transcriptional regulator [Methanopyrus sp. SNP6]